MPRLTGTIVAGGAPAEEAYVQIQNLAGDFRGEVRTDAAGRFVLHPIRGRWRLVTGCRMVGGRNRRSRWEPRTWTSRSRWPILRTSRRSRARV